MFELEYCNDLENIVLHQTSKRFDFQYDDVFDSKLNDLDRFLFLVDMHSIIVSCANDLLAVSIEDFDDFWKINKKLLNFVNAVYSYKEYVNSYEPSLETITDKYYKKKKWYRFICDFRNYVIHQSIMIKDYRPYDCDIFINIEDVAKQLNEYKYPKEGQKCRAVAFTKWLERFKDDLKEDLLVIKDNHFLSMKNITSLAVKEMSAMKEDVLVYAFKKGVKPSLEWLLEQIPIVDGKYQYAFIVDKDNPPEAVREPNYALEDFVRRMVKTLGENSAICIELFSLLEENRYLFFYDGNCGLEKFIENAKKTINNK